MKPSARRLILTWGLRLLLGMALGWGVRLLYERRPMMRFAAGLAVRSVRDPEAGTARGSHLRDGQPHFFSLDQIMDADDPAAALRSWREAFQRAPKEIQQQALEARAEVSVGALRRLIVQLSTSADLREEMNSLLGAARDLGADLYDPDAALRSLLELARLDPGLALDGAKAVEHTDAERMIWALIAEDDPRRVIDLVNAGQAPAGVLSAAIASLAARDFKEAEAVIRSLPADQQNRMLRQLADTLARTRPLEALALRTDGENSPDPAWAMKIIRHVPGPLAIDFLLALEREHPALLQSCSGYVSELLQRQAQCEPGFVFEWLERRGSAEGSHLAHQFDAATVTALAPHDPARAAALIQHLEEKASAPSQRASAKSDVFRAWMHRDPTAAMQWLVDQPHAGSWMQDQDHQRPWTDAVRPEQAAALARWLDDQGVLTRPDFQAAGALVKPWIQHDPAAAVAWAASLPEGGARLMAVTEAAFSLGQSRMPDRQAHLDALLHSAPDALGAVVDSIDPKALPLGGLVAEALPRLLPPGDVPNWGLTRHLAASLEDPTSRQKTLQAVAALPDPGQRQQLLEAMANQLDPKSPLGLTRQLADAMPDPEAARRFLENDVRARFQR